MHFLGVELIAALPTGWSKPGLVTLPTPSPPSIKINFVSGFISTLAYIISLWVASISSPPSLRIPQVTTPFPSLHTSSTCNIILSPLGTKTSTVLIVLLPNNIIAPALAAPCAQTPVV